MAVGDILQPLAVITSGTNQHVFPDDLFRGEGRLSDSQFFFTRDFRGNRKAKKDFVDFVNLRKFYAWGGDTFQVVPTRRGVQKHFLRGDQRFHRR